MTTTTQGFVAPTYFGISPLLIFPGALGQFSVYLRQQDGYVLYTSKGERFTQKHRKKLYDNGVAQVYIEAEERPEFERYVEENLGTILDDEDLPREERSKVLYTASAGILEETFEAKLPEAIKSRHFERVSNLVKQSIGFLSDDRSLKTLAPFISHDYRTYTHCLQVFIYTISILNTYKVSDETLFHCGMGAMLHDLGKTKIPVNIINKPGPLDDKEREVINTHPVQGVSLCAGMPLSQESLNCILFHHENMDGSGYPSGLKGEAIPLPVRVITACDVYDALTSDRPYARGRTPFEALKLMRNKMEKAFDLDVFKRLVTTLSGADIQVG